MSGSPGWTRTSDTPVNSRMLCQLSYRGSQESLTILRRVLGHVEMGPRGCWLWTGATSNRGYGQVGVAGKIRSTHRVVYELVKGAIPAGLTIDHDCHNHDATCRGGVACFHRLCLNPDHLDAVTDTENKHRAGHGLETPCLRGHLLSGHNLFIKKRGKHLPTRGCRACRAAYQRRRRAIGLVPTAKP